MKTETQNLSSGVYLLQYAYDKSGNTTGLTYPSGKSVNYRYDTEDRMDQVMVDSVVRSAYAFDVLGRRLTRVYATGTKSLQSDYSYDLGDQLSTLSSVVAPSTVIAKYDHTYDLAGNQITAGYQYTTLAKTTTTFGYNTIDELISTGNAQVNTYDYDKVGNREVVNGVAYTPNSLNQYTKVGAANYTYDLNGNLTNDGASAYTYDEANRLTTVVKAGITSSYQYDALDRRVSKTVNGVAMHFIYDGDEIIEERNSIGGLLADYVYSNRLDEVIAMTRGTQTYYYFQDRLGSVTEILDAAGAIKEHTTYDPYGVPSVVNSVIGNPWRFTGRYYDEESGMYDYRARVYSPAIGRFHQRDPIGYYDSMNLFEYVGNSPVNYIDPYGEFGQLVIIGWTIEEITKWVLVGYVCGVAIYNSQKDQINVPIWDFRSDDGEDNKDGPNDKVTLNPKDDYPSNPDDWVPPKGWKEVPTGKPDRHRHWEGPNGERRRWDSGGRKGGKSRGPHWHDSERPGEHIPPNR